MPSEERTGLFKRLNPSPDGLAGGSLWVNANWCLQKKTPTKFAIVSIKSSISAITRIVHLNLEKSMREINRKHVVGAHTPYHIDKFTGSDRDDCSTKRGSGGHDSKRKRPPLLEPLGGHSRDRTENHPRANSDQDSLTEKQLPKLFALRSEGRCRD